LDSRRLASGYQWQRAESGWKGRNGFWYLSNCVCSLAFERSGNPLLIGSRSRNGEAGCFDITGDKPVRFDKTIVHDYPITSVTVARNGHFLAAGEAGGHVVVWSAVMVKKLQEWTFSGPVYCVAFAPDGRHLALGNGDSTDYILLLTVPQGNNRHHGAMACIACVASHCTALQGASGSGQCNARRVSPASAMFQGNDDTARSGRETILIQFSATPAW
jgi:WD40 repeat protein